MVCFVEWIIPFLAIKPLEIFGPDKREGHLLLRLYLSLDALCTSDYNTASNDQIISEEWFGKELFVC